MALANRAIFGINQVVYCIHKVTVQCGERNREGKDLQRWIHLASSVSLAPAGHDGDVPVDPSPVADLWKRGI